MLQLRESHIFRPEPYIYGVYTVLLAGKSPNIRSYTVCIYSSGQPCTFCKLRVCEYKEQHVTTVMVQMHSLLGCFM